MYKFKKIYVTIVQFWLIILHLDIYLVEIEVLQKFRQDYIQIKVTGMGG